MFKNLTLYRFPLEIADKIIKSIDPGENGHLSLADSLGIEKLCPIGHTELRTVGWVSPYGDDRLFQIVGDCIMLALGAESKVLPPAAVTAEVNKRAEDEELRTDRAPGKRGRRRLKDEVIIDMLPRAFTAPSRLCGYLDMSRGILAVDTASRKAADEFVHHFRRTLGSFPALPLSAGEAADITMTLWLRSETMPAGLSTGEEWEFREYGTDVVWRGRNDAGDSDTVSDHVRSGHQCTRLALEFQDRLSFVIGEDLVIRKLRFLNGSLDKLDTEHDDAIAEADARFALLACEVGPLFDVLADAFQFSVPE